LAEAIVEEIAQPYQKANFEGYQTKPVQYIEEKLRAKLTPDQKRITEALMKYNRVMVKSCHSCLHPDAMVTLADGTYVRSEELVGKQFNILTLNKNEDIVSAQAECYYVDDSEMYRVTTESGRVFLRNYAHPFWAAEIIKRRGNRTLVNVKEWTKVIDLSVGDHIAVTEELPAFGNSEMDESLLKFLSYLIGDGHCKKGNIQFIQVDENPQLLEFIDCCVNLGLSCITSDGKHHRINGLRDKNGKIIAENFATAILERYGLLDKLSAHKHIPQEIFTLKKPLVRIFLSRLFSTDGWYYTKCPNSTNKKGTVEVGFCSLSEKLVRDISQLCLRFGVNGKVRYKPAVNAWIYEINQSKEVIKFIERIGIFGKEEKGEEVLLVAKTLFASKRSIKYRNKLAPKNTRWEKITSLEPLGENVTVNIEVPEYGRYLTEAYDKNSGKCVSGNHFIYLANGRKVQAKTLVGQTFETMTLTPLGPKKVVARAEWNTFEPVYEITTESGRRITVNENHPLWIAFEDKEDDKYIIEPKGWMQVKKIEAGDLVAVTKEFPAFGTRNFHPDDITLLAHLITNAYKNFEIITVIKKSDEQFNELSNALISKGARLSPIHKENRYIIEYSNQVENFYWSFGISDSFRHRKIPSAVFDMCKEDTLHFLKSIFLSNSLVVKNDDESKFKFYHRSEKLIRDISFLLLKFGINCKIYQKDYSDFWVLRILNVEEYVRLFQEDLELAEGNPDSRLNWRFEDAPAGTFWEKIKSIKWVGKEHTVAIHVPKYESYLTDFYEHNSYLAGALVNWNYDVFSESISLTTAPNEEVVKDVIWKEVRNHRMKLPQEMWDLAPKDTRMQNGPNHFATGYVAATEAGARGRKSPNLLIVFDEADGIRGEFFDAADGMLIAENAKLLVLLNPIHASSRAAADEDSFHTIRLSALDHPNVVAELKGEVKPFPGIDMNLGWVNDKIFRMCREIEAHNVKSNTNDFQWPPAWMYEDEKYQKYLKEIGAEQPRYFRPKPNTEFEPRVLGQWMSNSDIAIWSDNMWELVSIPQPLDTHSPVEIGVDQAGPGKDSSVFVVRRGRSVLWAESHEGYDNIQIADKAKELATAYGYEAGMTAETVAIKIDTTGGNGAYDLKGQFNFISVNASHRALEPELYPNRRSEVWFNASDYANEMEVGPDGSFVPKLDVSRLIERCPDEAKEIKRQLKAAEFKVRAGGKREVEPKQSMSKKLKRSPDGADAFNLSLANYDDGHGGRTTISSAAADRIRRHMGRRHRI
jgi:intein/homing endonuclease